MLKGLKTYQVTSEANTTATGADEVDDHNRSKSLEDGRRTGTELLPFSRIDRSAPFTLNALSMFAEWVAAEHYRLHVIEEWPEGPRKAVALSAIQSSLQSLLQNHCPDGPLATCEICLSRGTMALGMRGAATAAKS